MHLQDTKSFMNAQKKFTNKLPVIEGFESQFLAYPSLDIIKKCKKEARSVNS